MIKKIIVAFIVVFLLAYTSSCTVFQKAIDSRTGFTDKLKQTENYIRNDDWENAGNSLKDARNAWKKVKPLLQIDIDHDYVNSIEEDFIRLDGFIETKEKAHSLSTILLVKETWKNIGEL